MSESNDVDTAEIREQIAEQEARLEEQARELEALKATLDGEEWDGSVTDATRRQLLQGATALGAGALLGGGGAYAATDGAQAAASTSDGDGDIGTPNNRLDVYADGVDAQEVTTDRVDISNVGTVLQSGMDLQPWPMYLTEKPTATSSTSFTSVADGGGILPDDIPSSATLYGRMVARASAPTGETFDVQPVVFDIDSGQEIFLTELRLTFQDSFSSQDTGWTQMSSIGGSALVGFSRIEARVSGGSATNDWSSVVQPTPLFTWRIE